MTSFSQLEHAWYPKTESEKQQVLVQLENLLADTLFRNSKRYPAFLRFVVEQTLQGHEDALKERVLGMEVFHRTADYDTSLDSVVRLSAAEVRKRIAQYYQHPEHRHELKIDLNPGSYVPVFFVPSEDAGASGSQVASDARDAHAAPSGRFSRRFWIYAELVLAVFVFAGCFWTYISMHQNVTDLFWAQVSSSPGQVTLCVGDPDDIGTAIVQNTPAPQTVYNELLNENHLVGSDVVTLIRAGAALEGHHKPYRLTTAAHASFPQLREGPVVLVGALDNAWTMRLMEPLRFGFTTEGGTASIIDRRNPQAKAWVVQLNQSQAKQSIDYGVIARYHDTTIGQPVVIIAGLSSEGTEAAGEMLSNPDSLKALFKDARRERSTVNFEAIVQTHVVDGNPGPPRIVAVEYW
jgi:hypothetical protein